MTDERLVEIRRALKEEKTGDAEFVAMAKVAIPELLDLVRALQYRLNAYRQQSHGGLM